MKHSGFDTIRTPKSWGHSDCLEWGPFVSLHRCEVKAGYRCSTHRHANKWNGFFVESGHLRLRIWDDESTVSSYDLHPGSYVRVPPGVKHRFESVTDVVLFELYWPAEQAEDIIRDDEGGRL